MKYHLINSIPKPDDLLMIKYRTGHIEIVKVIDPEYCTESGIREEVETMEGVIAVQNIETNEQDRIVALYPDGTFNDTLFLITEMI